MPKSLHMLIAEQLKKPPMPVQPKKALHNGNNNVTNVTETVKKPKKGLSNKRKPTGEFKLFKEIAEKRSKNGIDVIALHVDEKTGKDCKKPIKLVYLRPENFSHTIPKGRDNSLRLVESNIEIVSRAWHYREHNGGILREVYKN